MFIFAAFYFSTHEAAIVTNAIQLLVAEFSTYTVCSSFQISIFIDVGNSSRNVLPSHDFKTASRTRPILNANKTVSLNCILGSWQTCTQIRFWSRKTNPIFVFLKHPWNQKQCVWMFPHGQQQTHSTGNVLTRSCMIVRNLQLWTVT